MEEARVEKCAGICARHSGLPSKWPRDQQRRGLSFQSQGCIQENKRFQAGEVIICKLVSGVAYNSHRGSVTGSKSGSPKLHMGH